MRKLRGSIVRTKYKRVLKKAAGKCCPIPSFGVGIELRRASCRWRVTVLALSIARRVHISTMATFPEAPYNPGQPGFPGPVRSLSHNSSLGLPNPSEG